MSVCANVIMKPIVTNNTLRKSIKNKKKPTSQTPKAYSINVSPQMIKDILRNECPVWPIIIEFSKQLSRVKMQMNKKRKKEAWPPYLTFRELEMRFHFNNLEFGPGPDFQTILQTLSNLTFKPAPLVHIFSAPSRYMLGLSCVQITKLPYHPPTITTTGSVHQLIVHHGEEYP